MSNIISATLQSKKKQIQTVFAQIRGVFTCFCTSAMLPSYIFLADVNSRALLLKNLKNSCILQIFAQITACLGCGGPTKQLGSFPHKLCHKSGKKRSILFRPFASSHATQRVHSKGSGGTKWGLGHTPPAPDVRSHASYSTSLLTSRGMPKQRGLGEEGVLLLRGETSPL